MRVSSSRSERVRGARSSATTAVSRSCSGGSEARQFDARGVVGEAARGKLVLIGAEQQREVGARFAALAQLVERHRVEAQLFEGVGEGARKSGEGGDGAEVGQSAGADRLLRDARGQRFADEAAHRHQRAAIQLGGGEFQDEFAEGQAVHADQGVAAGFERDFVGGLAHRRQHQHLRPTAPTRRRTPPRAHAARNSGPWCRNIQASISLAGPLVKRRLNLSSSRVAGDRSSALSFSRKPWTCCELSNR